MSVNNLNEDDQEQMVIFLYDFNLIFFINITSIGKFHMSPQAISVKASQTLPEEAAQAMLRDLTHFSAK